MAKKKKKKNAANAGSLAKKDSKRCMKIRLAIHQIYYEKILVRRIQTA